MSRSCEGAPCADCVANVEIVDISGDNDSDIVGKDCEQDICRGIWPNRRR